MIMGVTYMFNIFIKISRAMSLIYFMKHIKLPDTYNIIYRHKCKHFVRMFVTTEGDPIASVNVTCVYVWAYVYTRNSDT